MYCIIIYLSFLKLCLTSHPRSTEVLLDTGTPGTSGEIYSEDADDEFNLVNLYLHDETSI